MNIDFSKSFDRQFQSRLSARQQQQALEAMTHLCAVLGGDRVLFEAVGSHDQPYRS